MHDSREANVRAGRRLEYFTLGWNLTEAVVGISAGFVAGSIALIGFGADSVIESLSGGVMLWRFRAGKGDEEREHFALVLIGWCFLILALYVAFDAGESLLSHETPETSLIGIAL